MKFLGIDLDGDRNAGNEPIISRSSSPVTVRVMKTDEELMIAQHTQNLLRRKKE
jgi:acetate kinase